MTIEEFIAKVGRKRGMKWRIVPSDDDPGFKAIRNFKRECPIEALGGRPFGGSHCGLNSRQASAIVQAADHEGARYRKKLLAACGLEESK